MELEIVYLSPKDLKPYERNARKHSSKDIDQIKASIQADGFNDPIGIWGEENLIVEGHGRQIAAIQLQLEKVPCIRLDHMTEAQRRDYAIRHNRTAELSSWDEEILRMEMADLEADGIDMSGLEFDGLTFEDEEPETGELEEDEPPELREETITKRGEIWQLGRHRMMCGDATSAEDVHKLTGGGEADLLLTDPPYNVNYTGGTEDALKIENDKMGTEQFREFLTSAMTEAKNAIKPGAAFYVWHATINSETFQTAIRAAGLEIHQGLVWVKSQPVLSRADYLYKHEPCLYGWKPGAAHYWRGGRKQKTVLTQSDVYELRDKTAGELLKFIEEFICDHETQETDVLYEKKPIRNDAHPTMKPIALMGRLIRNSSREGETVLDLFGGSGSTLMACEQLGRTCWMMEIDPKYADVIIRRWEAFTGEKAVRIDEETTG